MPKYATLMPSGSAILVEEEEEEEEEEASMVKEGECDTENEFLLRGNRWVYRWEEERMGVAFDDLKAAEKKPSSLIELQQEAISVLFLFFFYNWQRQTMIFLFLLRDEWISGVGFVLLV